MCTAYLNCDYVYIMEHCSSAFWYHEVLVVFLVVFCLQFDSAKEKHDTSKLQFVVSSGSAVLWFQISVCEF
jgi:hypothetical protein